MQLNAMERLSIRKLYPQESNLMTQILVRDLEKKVGFKQEELKEFVADDGRISPEKAEKLVVEIDLSASEKSLLKDQIDKLDKQNKITFDLVGVCEKIKG